MNRIKTTTTTTGTGNITVSSTPAARCRPLSDIAAGKVVRMLIEDEAGTDWELVNATVIDATSFSRGTVINGSAGPGVKVNFGAGTKTVFVAAVLVDADIPFNATIPLDRPEIAYMAAYTMTGPLAFAAGANPVNGAHVVATIIGNGVDEPTYPGFVKHASSLAFNKTSGAKNLVQFLRTPGVNRYAVSQAFADVVATVTTPPTPQPTAVTMTGPTGGFVNAASTAFTVGTDIARTTEVIVTPTPVTGVTFTPTSVTLAAGSATATFTATPTTTGAKTIAVTNNASLTNPAAITYTAVSASSTVSGVTVSPSTADVAGGATQQFTPTVAGTNSPSQAVTWGASAGTISSGGLFTAPAATNSAQTITITATSTQDGTKSGTATVTVAAAAAVIYDTMLPHGSIVESGTSPKIYTALADVGTFAYGWTVNWTKHVPAQGDFMIRGKVTKNAPQWIIAFMPSASSVFQSDAINGMTALNGDTYRAKTGVGTTVEKSAIGFADNDEFKLERINSAGALGNTATLKCSISKSGGAFVAAFEVTGFPNGEMWPVLIHEGKSYQITELQSTGLVA